VQKDPISDEQKIEIMWNYFLKTNLLEDKSNILDFKTKDIVKYTSFNNEIAYGFIVSIDIINNVANIYKITKLIKYNEKYICYVSVDDISYDCFKDNYMDFIDYESVKIEYILEKCTEVKKHIIEVKDFFTNGKEKKKNYIYEKIVDNVDKSRINNLVDYNIEYIKVEDINIEER
jgi:hypothetical protein